MEHRNPAEEGNLAEVGHSLPVDPAGGDIRPVGEGSRLAVGGSRLAGEGSHLVEGNRHHIDPEEDLA